MVAITVAPGTGLIRSRAIMFAAPLFHGHIPPVRTRQKDKEVPSFHYVSPKAHSIGSPSYSKPLTEGKDSISADDLSRRQLTLLALAFAAALPGLAPPAEAGDASRNRQPVNLLRSYYDSTAEVLQQLRGLIAEQPDQQQREARLADFKTRGSSWVSDYRRLLSPGRRSYSETYGLVNTVLGHVNTYGLERPFPDRPKLEKRLQVAEAALARERLRDPAYANSAV